MEHHVILCVHPDRLKHYKGKEVKLYVGKADEDTTGMDFQENQDKVLAVIKDYGLDISKADEREYLRFVVEQDLIDKMEKAFK